MSHTCHWPGCPKEVDPSLWGCPVHWFRLPQFLQRAIWKWYVPGQEVTKTPSEQYVRVARCVQIWCEGSEARINLPEGGDRPLTPLERLSMTDLVRIEMRDAGLL